MQLYRKAQEIVNKHHLVMREEIEAVQLKHQQAIDQDLAVLFGLDGAGVAEDGGG